MNSVTLTAQTASVAWESVVSWISAAPSLFEALHLEEENS